MNSTISTLAEKVRGVPPKPGPLSQPPVLDPTRLDLFDTYNKRQWFTHPEHSVREFELEAQPTLLNPDRDVLPNEPLIKVVVDGKTFYQVLTRHQRGTLEQRKQADAPVVHVPTEHGVADLLNGSTIFTKQGRYHHRGCQQIEKVLFDVGGLVIHLTPARDGVFATRVGDTPAFFACADLFEKLKPLLLAWKRDGVAPPCRITLHKQPVEATTITVGREPWCGTCQPEVSR